MNSYSAVPPELKTLHNWVVWKAPSKIPYNPCNTQSGAKANDASTWGSYDEAVDAATLENLAGIGFEFGGTDCVGIDFDNVLVDGKPEDYVVEILEQLGSPYCEVSPSGTGLHAFIRCEKIPGTKRKFSNGEHYGAEIYSGREKGRYFTTTGDRFSGSGVPKLENIDIPYLLLSQIHDERFKKLWLGDASDYENDQSRADLALAWRLARLLDRNAALVEQAFNASKPGQREKWTSRQDYRDWTLTKACASKKEPVNTGVEPNSTETAFNESGNRPPVEAAEPFGRDGNEIEPESVVWLWKDRVPVGKITLFGGNPDNGKSLVANSIAAYVTTGQSFPDCPSDSTSPSDVILILGEDDLADTAVPRLIAAGADMSRIHFLEGVKLPGQTATEELRLDMYMGVLEKKIKRHPSTRLVIIDPISNYLGKVSMVAEQDARSILTPLSRLAEKMQVAVVIVMHLNKKSELEAINRIGGAMAFIGVARCSWMFVRDAASEDGEAKDSFTMAKIKNNLTPAKSGGLAYHIDTKPIPVKGQPYPVPFPLIVWDGVVQTTADQAIEGNRRRGRPVVEGGDSKLETAVQFLHEVLRDGPLPAKEISEQAKQQRDITYHTLRRAQEKLGIAPYKDGKVWKWKLSEVHATGETVGTADLVTVE
jgi:hypothetical protein